jgi:1,4-dihydroxy-6-naphthoate synthase
MADKEILLGHSPDADDAFMFFALTSGRVDTGPYQIREILADIQTLNQQARENRLDLTAISLHAYAYVRSHYALMSCGASMGLGYGPIIVAAEPLTRVDLVDATLAIPGTLTTAFLVARMALGQFDYETVEFDKIPYHVAGGSAKAGLIIHEGQVNYTEMGLHKVLDLGEWWKDETGLPLPLGVNVIRKSLGPAVIKDLTGMLRMSIEFAIENPSAALDFAQQYAPNLKRDDLERFVNMYVNKYTLNCGPEGITAINELLYRAERERLIPSTLPVEFV